MKHIFINQANTETWCGLCHRFERKRIARLCGACGLPICAVCEAKATCHGRYTRQNPGKDHAAGIKMYTEFHKFGPNAEGRFAATLVIPDEVYLVGNAEWVFYASTKWEKKQNFYMHEHGWGVKTYLTDGGYDTTPVPDKWRYVETLVRLGECRGGPKTLPSTLKEIGQHVGKDANEGKGLGFVWKDPDGNLDGAITASPYPELYCTPDGKCLLVIEAKRKIRAMIWGGGMSVKDVGIVG